MRKFAAYAIEGEAGKPLLKGGLPVLGMDCVGTFVRQVGSPEDRILEFIGSSEDVDRYQEVINVAGWDLRNWRANPVFQWAHIYKEPPIGTGVKVWKDLSQEIKRLMFQIRFLPAEVYDFAERIYQMFLIRALRATSVGFLPFDWKDNPDAQVGDMTIPYRIYTKQELLELSAVPVPANPYALVNAYQQGKLREEDLNRFKALGTVLQREVIDLSSYTRQPASAVASLACARCDEPLVRANRSAKMPAYCSGCAVLVRLETLAKPVLAADSLPETDDVEALVAEIDAALSKTIVSFSAHGELKKQFPEGTAWSAAKAQGRMRKWCSSDGSGDPTKMDMAQYKQGFTWYQGDAKMNMGSYKLPHHDIMDGALAHHWRGAAAAMGALLGSRGGVAIPDSDRKGVYTHLVHEYAVFDKTAPAFKQYGAEAEDLVTELIASVTDFTTAMYIHKAVTGSLPTDSEVISQLQEHWAEADVSEVLASLWMETGADAALMELGVRESVSTMIVEVVSAPGEWAAVDTLLCQISSPMLRDWANTFNVVVEYKESDYLKTKVLDFMRRVALRAAFEALPEADQATIRATTPENQLIDSAHPLLAAGYLAALTGKTVPQPADPPVALAAEPAAPEVVPETPAAEVSVEQFLVVTGIICQHCEATFQMRLKVEPEPVAIPAVCPECLANHIPDEDKVVLILTPAAPPIAQPAADEPGGIVISGASDRLSVVTAINATVKAQLGRLTGDVRAYKRPRK